MSLGGSDCKTVALDAEDAENSWKIRAGMSIQESKAGDNVIVTDTKVHSSHNVSRADMAMTIEPHTPVE